MALDLASAALKLVVVDDKEARSSQSSDRLLMKRRPPLSLFIPPRARSSIRQRAPVDLGPADRRSSRLALLRAAALLLSAIRTSRYALSSQEAHAENSQWPLGVHESGSVA
jgi:hypothetical protein